MTSRDFAKKFLDMLFERIKHGDPQHQAWLREECLKLEKDLALMIEDELDLA